MGIASSLPDGFWVVSAIVSGAVVTALRGVKSEVSLTSHHPLKSREYSH